MKTLIHLAVFALASAHARAGEPPVSKATDAAPPIVADGEESGILWRKSAVILRYGSGREDIDQPATFAFSHDFEAADSDDQFSADFFLGWTSGFETTDAFAALQASVEGHLNSADDDAGDAWRIRAGLDLDTGTMGVLDSSLLKVSLLDEANRDFDFQRLSAEVIWTPTIRSLHIGDWYGGAKVTMGPDGHRLPEDKGAVQWRWRPYVGFSAGGVISDDPAIPEEGDFRLLGKVVAEVRFNALAELMQAKEVSLFAEDSLQYLEDSGEVKNHFSASLVVMFTDTLGMNVTYKRGEDSPDFKQIDLVTAGVSLKF